MLEFLFLITNVLILKLLINWLHHVFHRLIYPLVIDTNLCLAQNLHNKVIKIIKKHENQLFVTLRKLISKIIVYLSIIP